MFKKNNHGLFCYCPMCKVKRRASTLHNIIISAIGIIVLYQSLITIIDFTRIHCFFLIIEIIFFTFFVSRILF